MNIFIIMIDTPSFNKFHAQIVDILQSARNKVVRSVNQTMVLTYFEIGKMIVEKEQDGKERADYGKEVLKSLSKVLTKEFGKGFSVKNLERMRGFYQVYRKSSTLLSKSSIETSRSKEGSQKATHKLNNKKITLSWSHYLKLMRIEDENERNFYEIEAARNNWSVRELQRQFDTALYTRLTLSRDKEKIKELSEKGQIIEKPIDAIKDPYILEFIGLPEHSTYSESELEQEIINKLEQFLLELGNGFTFVARQKRISFDEKHFKIDLVFYNRFLKCFVLVDLKIGEIKHQDLGQMQMYVNYYNREIKLDEENKTVGIVLCRDKNQSVVEYTLPDNNEQIFASKYKMVLPSKEDLKSLITEQNLK
jgi:predicted nuclease of restriction endonuclease-like (RecB) superfamily